MIAGSCTGHKAYGVPATNEYGLPVMSNVAVRTQGGDVTLNVVTLIEEDPAPASKDIIDRNNRLKFFVVFIFLNTCVILFVCA